MSETESLTMGCKGLSVLLFWEERIQKGGADDVSTDWWGAAPRVGWRLSRFYTVDLEFY